MSKLYRVLPGKYLHYPDSIGGRDRIWLKPGGIVDLDDPFIRSAVAGQEYKLEPDSGATHADALPHPKLLRMRDDFMSKTRGDEPAPTKGEELVAVGAGAAGEVQVPDARPQRSIQRV